MSQLHDLSHDIYTVLCFLVQVQVFIDILAAWRPNNLIKQEKV